MYKIIAIISLLVRQFLLPNPFECFGDTALLINIVVEPILHLATWLLVSTVYSRGSCPPLGAFLYLVFYSAIIGILWVMGIFSFAWWWVLIILLAMLGIYIGLKVLADKLSL